MTDFERLVARFALVETRYTVGGCRYLLSCVRDQDALLRSVTDEAELDRFPFGLLLWASAIALAETLAEEPARVAGKRVLEIGAGGVGLPGMVAAHLGAASVTQTDYHEESLTLLAHNTRTNGLPTTQTPGDWRDWRGGEVFDVVLGSDVLYERTLHDALLALLPRLVAPGGWLLLTDPLRPQGLAFVERLETGARDWNLPLSITGRTVTEADGTKKQVALFATQRKSF